MHKNCSLIIDIKMIDKSWTSIHEKHTIERKMKSIIHKRLKWFINYRSYCRHQL